MLNLFSTLDVPGVPHVQIFQDDQDDHLYYMLPEFPSISKATDGGPMLSMIVFARDLKLLKDEASSLGPTETEGGLLSMQVELSVSAQDQAKIINYIRGLRQGRRVAYMAPGRFRYDLMPVYTDAAPIKLSYPVWVDGDVNFVMIPDAGTGFVKATGGSNKPSLIQTNLANYTVLLGQEGETLFRSLVEQGKTPGSVQYKISFMARIPSLTIDVTGNMSDVYNEIKDYCQVYEYKGNSYYTYPQVSSLQEIRTKIASLNIVVKSIDWPSDADAEMIKDVENKLNDLAFNVVQTYIQNQLFNTAFTSGLQADKLGSTFDHTSDKPVPGNQLWLKDFSQVVNGSIDFHISYEKNIPITRYPNGLLLEILTAEQVKSRIIQADLNNPIFQVLEVPVRVTADFTADPVAAIKVMLDYKQTDDATGQVRAATNEFVFTTGTEVFNFRAIMAKDHDGVPKDTYTYRSEIIYKASSKSEQLPPQETRETKLVLGYDQLNCVRVQAVWGAIPDDTVSRVQVHFKFPGLDSPSAEKDVFLSPTATNDSWFTYTGQNASKSYQYQLTYFLASDEKLTLPAQTGLSSTLVVNAPFEETMRVTFVPRGTFPPTTSIVVSTRYQDPENSYHVEDVHTFNNGTDSWTWAVHLENPKHRDYQYQVIVTYNDGSSSQGDWTPGQEGTVLVGDVASKMLSIQVVTTLLDLQSTWKLVIVRLDYEDPAHNVSQQQILQITAANAATPSTWNVPIKDTSKKSYTYSVQAFGYDTTKTKTIDSTQTSDPLLLLNF